MHRALVGFDTVRYQMNLVLQEVHRLEDSFGWGSDDVAALMRRCRLSDGHSADDVQRPPEVREVSIHAEAWLKRRRAFRCFMRAVCKWVQRACQLHFGADPWIPKVVGLSPDMRGRMTEDNEWDVYVPRCQCVNGWVVG